MCLAERYTNAQRHTMGTLFSTDSAVANGSAVYGTPHTCNAQCTVIHAQHFMNEKWSRATSGEHGLHGMRHGQTRTDATGKTDILSQSSDLYTCRIYISFTSCQIPHRMLSTLRVSRVPVQFAQEPGFISGNGIRLVSKGLGCSEEDCTHMSCCSEEDCTHMS
jgi:hypothetical protein